MYELIFKSPCAYLLFCANMPLLFLSRYNIFLLLSCKFLPVVFYQDTVLQSIAVVGTRGPKYGELWLFSVSQCNFCHPLGKL